MSRDSKKDKQNKASVDEYLKQLVIARLEASSGNLKLMIGGAEEMTREDLIKNVRSESDLGKEVIAAQIEFLKAMAEGKIYENG